MENTLGAQEDLLTAADAARELGVSRQRMTELANQGRLGRRVAGRYWVFTRKEIEEYKRQRRVGRPRIDRSLGSEKSNGARPSSLDDDSPTSQ